MRQVLCLLFLLTCGACGGAQPASQPAPTRLDPDMSDPLAAATTRLGDARRAVHTLLEDMGPYQAAVDDVTQNWEKLQEARRHEDPEAQYAANKAMVAASKAADQAEADISGSNPQVAAAQQKVVAAQAEVNSILDSEARSVPGPTSGDVLMDKVMRAINKNKSPGSMFFPLQDMQMQGLTRDRIKPAIPELSKMILHARQAHVRVNAIEAISTLTMPLDDELGRPVSAVLLEALGDSDVKVRREAADNLETLATFYEMARHEGRLLPALRQRMNAETDPDTKELLTDLVDFLDKNLRLQDKAQAAQSK